MTEPETACQPYLIVPHDIGTDTLAHFAGAGGFENVACAMLRAEPDGMINRGRASLVLEAAHAAGVPLLFERDTAAAAALGADGIHIPANEDLYAQAQRDLGDEAVIGAACGLSRHDGLTLGELGADYVAFACEDGDGALEELVAWWSDVTVVPCVAWDVPDIDAAERMAKAGADFVAVDAAVWAHGAGAAEALSELARRIAGRQAAA